MKIKNSTRYSTRELRSLFSAVYRNLAKHEGAHFNWRGYTFHVGYSRRRGRVSGNAWIRGVSANIFLPRGRVDTTTLAIVVEHELLHSYGYRHNAIGSLATWGDVNRATFAWVPEKFGPVLEEKEKAKRAKPTGTALQEHRYRLVKAGIERWEKRKKAAETRLKNLRRKARYYERALAATKEG